MRPHRTLISLLAAGLAAACAPGDNTVVERPGEAEAESLAARGEETANALAQTLIAQLLPAIQERGAAGAVDFCSEEALPLTARVAAEQGMDVKRTSLRYRNPENAPDSLELEALHHFEATRGEAPAGGWLQAISSTEARYYKPLYVAELCVQCHGGETDLAPGIPELLRDRYPGDRATGYALGDFRGVIRVTLPRTVSRRP